MSGIEPNPPMITDRKLCGRLLDSKGRPCRAGWLRKKCYFAKPDELGLGQQRLTFTAEHGITDRRFVVTENQAEQLVAWWNRTGRAEYERGVP